MPCHANPRPATITQAKFSKTLLDLIAYHGGRQVVPCHDIVGERTICVGRSLTGRGCSDDEITVLFIIDMRLVWQICRRLYTDFSSFSSNRQVAAEALSSKMAGQLLRWAVEIARLLRG